MCTFNSKPKTRFKMPGQTFRLDARARTHFLVGACMGGADCLTCDGVRARAADVGEHLERAHSARTSTQSRVKFWQSSHWVHYQVLLPSTAAPALQTYKQFYSSVPRAPKRVNTTRKLFTPVRKRGLILIVRTLRERARASGTGCLSNLTSLPAKFGLRDKRAHDA